MRSQIPEYFQPENFVLLKSDVKLDGDTVISKLDDLNLWKIAGKALLQKFIPFESDGRILHKCTCVYSGWNVKKRDNYYPITKILDTNPRTDAKEFCVALDLNDLINMISPEHFRSENFVLLKSDVIWDGDTVISKLDDLTLWKITGKILLQKFIPMEFNGKIIHRTTCVYTGWDLNKRDKYYPITEILDTNPCPDSKEQCVALDLKDLIKVRDL